MSALLTSELIASTIEQAPIQGRVMLKLLLLQHFDITPEEISYIATRPTGSSLRGRLQTDPPDGQTRRVAGCDQSKR